MPNHINHKLQVLSSTYLQFILFIIIALYSGFINVSDEYDAKYTTESQQI